MLFWGVDCTGTQTGDESEYTGAPGLGVFPGTHLADDYALPPTRRPRISCRCRQHNYLTECTHCCHYLHTQSYDS
jgi:hypothetical protein